MTSTAIKLAKECGAITPTYKGEIYSIGFGQEGFERFYAKAQAQALKNAAKEFNSVPMPQHWIVYALLEKAEKLERQC